MRFILRQLALLGSLRLSARASLFAPLGVTLAGVTCYMLPYESDRLRGITRPVFGLSSPMRLAPSGAVVWYSRKKIAYPSSIDKLNKI